MLELCTALLQDLCVVVVCVGLRAAVRASFVLRGSCSSDGSGGGLGSASWRSGTSSVACRHWKLPSVDIVVVAQCRQVPARVKLVTLFASRL